MSAYDKARQAADDGWEFVTDENYQIPAPAETSTKVVSRSLFELRVNIGRREWSYSNRGNLSHQDAPNPEPFGAEASTLDVGMPLPQKQSIFFRIPLEIRLYIYELVLKLPPHTQVLNLGKRFERHYTPSVLVLLETCRLILHEAELIFYSINRFCLRILPIPRSLPSRRSAAIKAIEVSADHPATIFALIEALSFAPNLQSVHITTPTGLITYINVKHWKVMMPQIEAGLKKLRNLKEVKVGWRDTALNLAKARKTEHSRQLVQVAARLEALLD